MTSTATSSSSLAPCSPYCLTSKSDADLVRELGGLAQDAARLMAMLLAYLAELDTRRGYLGLGFSSLFAFATTRLGFSEDEACKRTQACRAARAYPVLFEMVAEGRIHLTAINLLAPHLTPDNHVALLTQACGKKKTEVELLVATHFPQPDVATSLRKLPAPPPAARAVLLTPAVQMAEPAAAPMPLRPRPVVLSPLSSEQYKLQLTLSRKGRQLLLHAQALLSHQIPNGDLAVVIERALQELCSNLERKQLGRTRGPKDETKTETETATAVPSAAASKSALSAAASASMTAPLATDSPPRARAKRSAPERTPGAPDVFHKAGGAACQSTAHPAPQRSRHIPNAVRREVVARDGYRCSYVGSQGPCLQTRFLQFHHVEPFAKGGPATAANVKLYCAQHNRYRATLDFGDEVVQDAVARRRVPSPPFSTSVPSPA